MDTPKIESLVDQRHRTLSIVCGAIVVSLAIYSGVAWVVLEQTEGAIVDPATVVPMLPWTLAAIGVLMLATSKVISTMVFNRAHRSDGPAEKRIELYAQSVIIGFALREGTGIIGLVITLLTGDFGWVLALSGVAAVSMAAAWPRRELMIALARQ